MGAKAITGRNAKLLLGTADPADQAVAELRNWRISFEPETVDLTSTDDTERDIRTGAYARSLEGSLWFAEPDDPGQDLILEAANLYWILQPKGAGSGSSQFDGFGQVAQFEISGDVDGGVEYNFTMNRLTFNRSTQA